MTKFFEDYVIDSYKTGSRHTCYPPVMTTDDDTVFYVKPGYEQALGDEGFVYTESEHSYESKGIFTSWRKDDQNYIVTEDKRFYEDFCLATRLAKKLNLQKKEERIALFKGLLYER